LQHSHAPAQLGWRCQGFFLVVLVPLGLAGFMVAGHVPHQLIRGLGSRIPVWVKVAGTVPLVLALHPLLTLLHPGLLLLAATILGVRKRRAGQDVSES
jgi:hypothetical protein